MSAAAAVPLWVDYCARDMILETIELSLVEYAVYHRLYDLVLKTGDELDDDDERLARVTQAGELWAEIKASLIRLGKIAVDGGRIVIERCRDGLAAAQRRMEQRSAAGSASAAARRPAPRRRVDAAEGQLALPCDPVAPIACESVAETVNGRCAPVATAVATSHQSPVTKNPPSLSPRTPSAVTVDSNYEDRKRTRAEARAGSRSPKDATARARTKERWEQGIMVEAKLTMPSSRFSALLAGMMESPKPPWVRAEEERLDRQIKSRRGVAAPPRGAAPVERRHGRDSPVLMLPLRGGRAA